MTNLISEHIDVWMSAQTPKSNGRGNGSAYGIKKLRELILELAVRGKLVPQDPNDEPASVLLERIAKEKARLIKEGKIKKEKPLQEIGDDEKLFELPKGWEWVRLGSFSEIKGGKRLPAGHSFSQVKTPYIYIQVTNMKDGRITRDNPKYISKETQCEISQYTISKDDLYITIAGTIGAVGVVPDYFDGMNLTENAAKIVFRTVDKKWLQKVLSSKVLQIQFTDKTNQLAQPKLALHRIASSCIALPPIKEQQRIVAKVNELMVICDQLEQQQNENKSIHLTLVETMLGTLTETANHHELESAWQHIAEHFDTLFTTEESIDRLKQTILQLAVMGKLVPQDPNDLPASLLLEKIAKAKARLLKEGKIKKEKPLPEISEAEKPFSLPQSWEWVRFNQLVNPEYPISYGVLVPGPDIENGVPFIRICDLDLVNPPIKPEKSIDRVIDEQYERTRIFGGEILMGVVGSIGKLGIAPDSWCGANIARAICRIVPTRFVYKEYIIQLLQSDLMQTGFIGDTKTLAQPTLNIGLIRNAITPLPPLVEQHRIVAKVDELMALCDTLKARLNEAQTTQTQLADAIIAQALI